MLKKENINFQECNSIMSSKMWQSRFFHELRVGYCDLLPPSSGSNSTMDISSDNVGKEDEKNQGASIALPFPEMSGDARTVHVATSGRDNDCGPRCSFVAIRRQFCRWSSLFESKEVEPLNFPGNPRRVVPNRKRNTFSSDDPLPPPPTP